ncbi:MAG: FkbM family methyltransferase [Sphingobacteriales bacterium]|uniref:FkbM family methyltransferase n=1 Tax=Hydrotalea flava TaxID=714549 RepID=UPI000836416B|nr:FkbM family methyltransferase [Hydrotalea flava]RTL49075.1 MAG: FkbM family methyltransferase [Sphingobacteriales bacterium]
MDFKKPQYYLNPKMIIRRFCWKGTEQIVTTALGITMRIDPAKVIGKSVGQSGVYDIVLSESLFRLSKNAEFVLDIGANIGFTVGVAAKAMNKVGKLWAFEPNPVVLPYLYQNVQYLAHHEIQVFSFALSNRAGEALLQIPAHTNNEGLAHITDSFSESSLNITTETLDHLIPVTEQVAVMKIDVEGHELAVLQGGEQLLNQKKITHILFEDHAIFPSNVSAFLLHKGYTIYRLEKGWYRVLLKNPYSTGHISQWEPANYLATLDVDAVKKAFKNGGYQCIG